MSVSWVLVRVVWVHSQGWGALLGREEAGGDMVAGGPWGWVAKGTGSGLPVLLDT